jgi:hypothetical protein
MEAASAVKVVWSRPDPAAPRRVRKEPRAPLEVVYVSGYRLPPRVTADATGDGLQLRIGAIGTLVDASAGPAVQDPFRLKHLEMRQESPPRSSRHSPSKAESGKGKVSRSARATVLAGARLQK